LVRAQRGRFISIGAKQSLIVKAVSSPYSWAFLA
jgi:hypothetical protein